MYTNNKIHIKNKGHQIDQSNEYGLNIRQYICTDIKFLECNNVTVIIWENIIILKRSMLKYLGVKYHDICNLHSNDQWFRKKNIHTYTHNIYGKRDKSGIKTLTTNKSR